MVKIVFCIFLLMLTLIGVAENKFREDIYMVYQG